MQTRYLLIKHMQNVFLALNLKEAENKILN